MDNNLEKLFKTALEEVTVDPPARVWTDINSRLGGKQNRFRQLFIYSGAAAGIVLLLSSLFMLQQEKKKTPYPPLAKIQTLKPPAPYLLAYHSPVPTIPPVAHRKTEVSGTPEFVKVDPMTVQFFDSGLLLVSHPVAELEKAAIREDFIPLINKEALENQRRYLKLIHEQPAVKKKKLNLKYTLSGYVSPGYSSGSYHMENKQSRLVSYTDDQLNGIFNMNGGITFAVSPGNRISLETGIGYTRIGQKTSDSKVFVPRTNAMMSSYNSQTRVLTPLGNVKSRSNAAVFVSNSQLLRSNSETTGSIEQEFDAIEVPLSLRYYLNNNKLKFSILGGFGASFLVRNMTYLRYEGVKEKMGETDNIRRINMSTHVGLGVEYPIGKSIHFKIEPGFKYYLQSLSKDPDIRYNPYTFTFSTGFGISF